MQHVTREELDGLRLKSDVAEVAEAAGLSTEGTRAEITERILARVAEAAANDAAAVNDAGDGGGPPNDPPPDEATQDPSVETPVRARDEDGKFSPDDPETAPDEAWDPPTPGSFTKRALTLADNLLGSYLGADAIPLHSSRLREALAAGHQPCIVKGTGNSTFELKVFERPFRRSEHATDVSKSRDGAVLNIARHLCDKNLYP